MRGQLGKAVWTFKWQEQNACKRAVNIGQRDQHVVAPRPDVQCICFQRMLSVCASRNRKLLVPVVQILLRKVKATEFEHFAANRRRRPITPNGHTWIQRSLLARSLIPQLKRTRPEVHPSAALLERDL